VDIGAGVALMLENPDGIGVIAAVEVDMPKLGNGV
jgi:hypothetical protein